MTDSDDRESKTGGGRRTLKAQTDGSQVQQSFSRGRSKSVVVEKKRRRTVVVSKSSSMDAKSKEAIATPAPEPKKSVSSKGGTLSPTPAVRAERYRDTPKRASSIENTIENITPEGAGEGARPGVVLRTLTAEEKKARASALDQARIREAEDRRKAEEARVREQEESVRREREAAEASHREEEEARRKAEEETARQAAEMEAARRLKASDSNEGVDTDSEGGSGRGRRDERASPRKPSQGRREERPRRAGKLTIANALKDDSRQRSMAAIRRHREREKKQALKASGVEMPTKKVSREVVIPEVITIQELANRMAERAVDIIKILMQQGTMAKINDVIDSDTAQLIAEELGHKVVRVAESDVEEGLGGEEDNPEDIVSRAPVVTIMGHVDHGKTSLLDILRRTDIAAGEAGGITQHIGAYQVTLEGGTRITFLDTPGHEVFTSMRARGTMVTDIVILVVAADDGVMPQTIESINHALAAGVPIIVALNKMDKPEADPDKVRGELLQHGVITEAGGGAVLCVEVSAETGDGVDKLTEAVLLQAEILELKANPTRTADGVIIDARLDRGRGQVATVLVQRGTLRAGDIFVAGAEWGRVRTLIDDKGEAVKEAYPSMPVEVLGMNGMPVSGDQFHVVENEARAREITEYRQRQLRERRAGNVVRGSLASLMNQVGKKESCELPVVIKADAQGSGEAIAQGLDRLGAGSDEVKVRVIHVGAGGITESDVALASASEGLILAFNVRPNALAREAAQKAGVDVRCYSVIYELIDDMRKVMSGFLEPEMRENVIGKAAVLETFTVSKAGRVAGCQVREGSVRRGTHVRLIRDDTVVHQGALATLKRFTDDVAEVATGQECGISLENYQDVKQGDVIECFEVERIERSL
ncbi:MAG: translation initiation factor IF-2 [Parvularculales bacterium]